MKQPQLQADTERLLAGINVPAQSSPASNARPFVVYNGYRTLVAACLLTLLILPATAGLFSGFDRTQLMTGAGILLVSAVLLAGPPGRKVLASETGVFGLMLGDTIAVTLIASAGGGVLSGFSVLYLIAVAAAAVMLHTRILATLIAAIAVIAVLFDTLWLVSQGEADMGMMLPAGILGSILFAVSLLVQMMANRLASVEQQATAAESRAQALQQLNQQIILHIQTGILLLDADQHLIPINAAARRLLNLGPETSTRLESISPELERQYHEWNTDEQHRPTPFRPDSDSPQLVASFARLDDQPDGGSLIFLEDYTPVTQFAQSLKLNSLSKLTASIAHEIRNPLGAISHAAQLLSENQTVNPADAVLYDIIVNNSERVSNIISNVSDVSRRQAPRPVLIEVNAWLEEFIEDYQQQQTHPCQITFQPSTTAIHVNIDPKHLQRILTNLIDNARRYSHENSQGDTVKIAIVPDAPAAQVYIDVIDFGIGVIRENISHLFEPFFTTSANGTGLGLYLCKDLCEINGAGLAYKPTAEGQSAFRISLRQKGMNSW